MICLIAITILISQHWETERDKRGHVTTSRKHEFADIWTLMTLHIIQLFLLCFSRPPIIYEKNNLNRGSATGQQSTVNKGTEMSPTLFLFLCWPTSFVLFHPAGAIWAHWWAVNTRVLLLRVIIVHIFTLHKTRTPIHYHYKEQDTTQTGAVLLSVIIMIFNLSHSQCFWQNYWHPS